ncbi:MAG: hypothetical protein ACJZ9G_00035 [Rhodospirillales bacterium]
MREFLFNFLIIIVSTLGSLIVIEYSVRLIFPQYDPSGHVDFIINSDGIPVSKKKGIFRQIKNTGDYNVQVKISPLGLRESKPLNISTSNDLFVVGDSFSFGWGVEEENRFSNILDHLLPHSRVFNISIPTDFTGYNKLVTYAQKNGAKIDRLIIGVTMENDIQKYDPIGNSVYKEILPVAKIPTLSAFKYLLRNNSALYFLITSVVHMNPTLKNIGQTLGLIVNNYDAVRMNNYDVQKITASARQLHLFAKKIRTLVLIIPSRGLWVGNRNNRKIASQIHESFISEIKKLNIDYVDMRQVFESSGKPMTYHFRHDGHWTKEAHNKAGRELERKINIIEKLRQRDK